MIPVNAQQFSEGGQDKSPVKAGMDNTVLTQVVSALYESVVDIQTNYEPWWNLYERSYRRDYQATDKTRASERSTYISPITMQAIDTVTAEVVDSTFGYGRFIDLVDDPLDQNPEDVEKLSVLLYDELTKQSASDEIEQVVTTGHTFGTGIGEIVMNTYTEYTPTSQPGPKGQMLHGVTENKRTVPVIRAISPKNFRIAPGHTEIDTSPWVGVETYVATAMINKGVASGLFKDPRVAMDYAPRFEMLQEASQTRWPQRKGMVLLSRYYGLLPAYMVKQGVSMESKEGKALVESVVYIVNRSGVLRARPNPYMCQDRGFAAYRPKRVLNQFWGVGIAEDISMDQRNADKHVRTHDDAMAYTAYPSMGMDATRIPKGVKLEISPGKNLLFNGPVSDIVTRLPFGEPNQASMVTAQQHEAWSKSASGIADLSGMSNVADMKTGALSIAMGPQMKRLKRLIRAFQVQFLVPIATMYAKRMMQFDPDSFPAKDYSFKAVGTMSMLEREFEQTRVLNMLSTLGPESPLVPLMLGASIQLSSLPGRSSLAKLFKQMGEEKQAQQQQQPSEIIMKELALRVAAAGAQKDEAEAMKMIAEAAKSKAEAMHVEDRIQADIFKAMVMNSDAKVPDDIEFERRYKAMEMILKAKDIDEKAEDRKSNEKITKAQIGAKMGMPPDETDHEESFKALLDQIMSKE
jgi:hypothetical protein